MSKKTVIFGLLAALVASTVGGAFTGSQARADYNPSWGALYCTASVSTVRSGDFISFSASYANSGWQYSSPQFSWSAVGGTPATGSGNLFGTRFYTNSISETRLVTVSDGYQSGTCAVVINGSSVTVSPTPTQYGYSTVSHSVTNVTRGGNGASVIAYNGDRLQYIATITTGSTQVTGARIVDTLPSYARFVSGTTTVNGTWYADGITSNGLWLGTLSANSIYTVKFDVTLDTSLAITSHLNTVAVYGDNVSTQSRTSLVTLNGATVTPTPTAYPYGTGLAALQYGRNVTRGQSNERTSLVARGNETLDFIVHIRNNTGVALSNVYVTDPLPVGMNYVFGSTTLNGVVAANGVTSSGLNIGSLAIGQEATVKFSVVVDGAYVPTVGQVTLRNTVQVRADGQNTVSAQLPVTLGVSLITSVAGVQTGPVDSIALALAIGALITGMYALYTRTNVFGRRLALAHVQRATERKGTPNFLK